MSDLDTTDTLSCVVFAAASVGLITYVSVMTLIILSIIAGKLHFHKITEASELGDAVPGVSVIKPVMGVDALLEHNLESHFKLTYPKFELLFCFHDDQDSGIPVVERLRKRYPAVDAKIFTNGKREVPNPMVQNMAQGYDNAQYEYVWISSSRIEASNEIIFDMAGKLQKSNVSLVHQIPFTTDSPGFGSAVEKVYFGAAMMRFYIALNVIGISCVTGMSYMFKKALLDQANGLSWYGRYLAEDCFLARALQQRGHLIMSAVPAPQNNGRTTVCAFADRMTRWVKLRLHILCGIVGVVEPLTECFPLGVYAGWAVYYFFEISPFKFFCFHVFHWLVLDFMLLKTVQNGPLLFSIKDFVIAWVVREFTSAYILISAVVNPHYIKWGSRTFRVKMGGLAEEVEPSNHKRKMQPLRHILAVLNMIFYNVKLKSANL